VRVKPAAATPVAAATVSRSAEKDKEKGKDYSVQSVTQLPSQSLTSSADIATATISATVTTTGTTSAVDVSNSNASKPYFDDNLSVASTNSRGGTISAVVQTFPEHSGSSTSVSSSKPVKKQVQSTTEPKETGATSSSSKGQSKLGQMDGSLATAHSSSASMITPSTRSETNEKPSKVNKGHHPQSSQVAEISNVANSDQALSKLHINQKPGRPLPSNNQTVSKTAETAVSEKVASVNDDLKSFFPNGVPSNVTEMIRVLKEREAVLFKKELDLEEDVKKKVKEYIREHGIGLTR
jgi:hypothetical protein